MTFDKWRNRLAILCSACLLWVKIGKARTEHFMSALHPAAAEERTSQIVRLVPNSEVAESSADL